MLFLLFKRKKKKKEVDESEDHSAENQMIESGYLQSTT